MAKKIAKVDADAMNSLYAGEYERISGSKIAVDVKDRNGAPEAQQAFKDHGDYLDTLTAVLKEDASEDFDPNTPLKD